eukprot:TRINITY_DN15862_c0_g1_i2.p1 TRINITY_DN15862_c0_g1~~TRINITY_DN15862_c0_g1_i2.p1  ORF type:complete len:481 (-),score=124.96 TRINITY_DN15862_c0_g1_i2:52-1494(-)
MIGSHLADVSVLNSLAPGTSPPGLPVASASSSSSSSKKTPSNTIEELAAKRQKNEPADALTSQILEMQRTFQEQMAQQNQMMMQLMNGFIQSVQHQQQQQQQPVQQPPPQQHAGTEAAPPHGDAPVADNSTTDDAWVKELESQLVREKNKFKKKLKTYLRSIDTHEKRQSIHKAMVDDTSYTRWPPGMRGYKASPTEAELDECWSRTKQGDYKLEFEVKANTSRRTALETLYFRMVTVQREILVEAAAEKVQTMKTATRRSTFADAIKAIHTKAVESTEWESLGIDKPKRQLPEKWLDEKTESLYSEAVDKAAKEKRDDDRKADEKRNEDEATDEALAAEDPAELLDAFVEKKFMELRKKDLVDDADMDGNASKPIDKRCTDLVRILAKSEAQSSKKGSAESGQDPPWNTSDGKATGRRGRNQSIGKSSKGKNGKGKGKGSNTPAKGKGKGKKGCTSAAAKPGGKEGKNQLRKYWRGSYH